MIHVLATIELATGRRSEFLREFHAIMPSVKAETGCLEYGPAVDTATQIPAQGPRPDTVVVIEKWAGLPALEKPWPHRTCSSTGKRSNTWCRACTCRFSNRPDSGQWLVVSG